MNAPLNSVEIIGKRTSNAKHYRLEDGTFQAKIFGGDIHYPDKDGNWQDINTSLFDDADFDSVNFPVYSEKQMEFVMRRMEVQNFKSKGTLDRTRGDFHGLAVPHDSKIAKDFSKGYQIGKGLDRLKFIPDGANSVIGSIDANNRSVVRFTDAWADTDVTLELKAIGIKESIILKTPNAPTKFSFVVGGMLASDLTSGALKLEPAWLQDANGSKKDVTQTVRTGADGNTYLDLVADTTGLAFPVVIDPTVTVGGNVSPTAGGPNQGTYIASGQAASTNESLGMSYVIVGVNSTTTEMERALYQFDTSSIPANSSIVSSVLSVKTNSTQPGTSGANVATWSVTAHQNLASWNANTVTWNNAPSYGTAANSPINFTTVVPSTNTWFTTDITAITQNWVNGQSNYGITMVASVETLSGTTQQVEFYNVAANANSPYMTVNYDVPPTAPGAITAPAAGATVNSTQTITWGAASDSSSATIGGTTVYTSLNGIKNTSGQVYRLAQNFTTPADATYLSTVGVYFAIPSGYTSANFTVDLYNVDTNGNPTTLIKNLGTENVSGMAANTYSTSFTANYALSPNTQYAVVLTNTSANPLNFPQMQAPVGNEPNYCLQQIYGQSTWGQDTYPLTVQFNLTTNPSQLTYQIDLSTNNGSTWTNIVSATAAGATSYTYDFTNTAATTQAIVRVRAYDGQAYGAYTSGPTFTIQHNQPPNAPAWSNISSNGGSYNQKPKLFAGVGDPDSGNTIQNVEIQIASNNTFSTIVQDVQYGNDSGYGTQTAGWSGMPTTTNASTTVNWTPQTALAAGTYYARVRCKDNNNAWGAWSATQQFFIIAVPWSDTPNGNGYKAQWMNDLATAINNVRQFRGIATFAFTDGTVVAGPSGTDMKAVHVTERRTKITDVYSVVGGAPTWTNATIDNTKDRSGQDIIDLRNAVTAA